jgi:hypothetical protein
MSAPTPPGWSTVVYRVVFLKGNERVGSTNWADRDRAIDMTEIIKIQRSLSSNYPSNPWLLFDKKQMHVEHSEESLMDKKVKAAMGDAVKGYFEAEWSLDGWKIGRKVRDQDW